MSRTRLYTLTDEHRAQLPGWARKWIANAMSTSSMDAHEREIVSGAVLGLYEAAGLPPPKHIVFVPSPFVLRFAGGFAAAIWYHHHNTTSAATDAAVAATRAATRDATYAATRDATRAATRAATSAATSTATSAATRYATRAATRAATRDATRDATSAATRDAIHDDDWYQCDLVRVVEWVRSRGDQQLWWSCAQMSWRMVQGGNQWSDWDSWVTFFRDVVGLKLSSYDKYAPWGEAAVHAGPRIMHADFCMISDRPDILTVDGQNRPHSDNGPFCRWRDGSALYAIHGVRVPWWVVEHPDRLTVGRINKETNVEIRRVMIERYGQDRYLMDSGAVAIHQDDFGVLYRKELSDDESLVMVKVVNSTPKPDGSYKDYFLRVPPTITTARQAVAWTFEDEDYAPEVET